MGIVRVENLEKVYSGGFKAVDGVSFTVEPGEIFGFLGPNGAGKTTTINMMIGLARPTSGTVFVDGIDVVKNTKAAQAVMGIVPDESNLYDEMDGFENLCFAASLYGIGKSLREGKARELLALFDLEKAGKRRYKVYSKGMKRKLTIAAGIIHSPKVLFLDEPTTGIDVESARQIREIIRSLKDDGATVFITTHYLEDAERMCDRIAFIVNGTIVDIGTVDSLLKHITVGNTVKITSSALTPTAITGIKEKFPEYSSVSSEGDSLMLISEKCQSLIPVLQYLDSLGLPVYEAVRVQPSLEDVFVHMTGLTTVHDHFKENPS